MEERIVGLSIWGRLVREGGDLTRILKNKNEGTKERARVKCLQAEGTARERAEIRQVCVYFRTETGLLYYRIVRVVREQEGSR